MAYYEKHLKARSRFYSREKTINSSFTGFGFGSDTLIQGNGSSYRISRFNQTIFKMVSALSKQCFLEKDRARVVFRQSRVMPNELLVFSW
jgi:hypothetical protein